MFIYFLFFVALTLILGAGWWIFRSAQSRGISTSHASMLALCTSLFCLSLWPIPIHGGVTFLGEIAYREVKHSLREKEHAIQVKKKTDFVEHYDKRTQGHFTYLSEKPLNENWLQITTPQGSIFFDNLTGHYWSSIQHFRTSSPLTDLPAAKAFCQNLAPQGLWTLPTEVEQYYFWKNHGAAILPDGGASAIAILIDDNTQFEMPSVNLTAQSRQKNGIKTLPIRCLSPHQNSRPHHALKAAITLDEWNHYQLSKLLPQKGL